MRDIDKMRVAIYDEDVEYSRRLMNYLNGKYGQQIDAIAFSQKEHLVREAAEYGFDCVVTQDSDNIGAVPVIRIYDEETEDGYYRYGSAKELAEKLVSGYHGENNSLDTGEKIIGVYSVSEMGNRTYFALQKAKQLDGVYIGMEEFCSFETDEYWMEELLFLIRQRAEDICQKLKEHLQWYDGIRYLPAARCFLDYRFMNYEDYRWFFEILSNEINSPVVFDIGVGNFPDFQLFAIFDALFFLTSASEIGKKKEHVFMNLLAQEVPDIHEKIIFEKVETQ